MNGIVPLTDLELFNKYNSEFDEFEGIPEYKLKIREFANKTVDYIVTKTNFTRMQKEPFRGEMTIYPKDLTEAELEAKRLENIERAARRARQAVHFHVRQIGADHMLTLHTRECITDLKEFDEIFTRFIRLVREKIFIAGRLVPRLEKHNWAYVAVREFQERGALHMHIACVGRQDVATLRACWYVALGGSVDDIGENVRGQVDVKSNSRRFSGETIVFKTFKLVSYLTKYISKTFEDNTELGQRRYKSSRNIPKPNVQKQYLQAYFSYGDKPFTDAMKEVISIAGFHGVKDFQLWNRGQDIFILRGTID